MRPILPLAAAALAAVAATAFAPVTSGDTGAAAIADLSPFERTVDGIDVYASRNASFDKPTVLVVADKAFAEEHHDLLSDGDRYTVALVDLGCGDLGGPQDVAGLTAVTEYVAGERDDDDGHAHSGNGEVLLLGVGIGGLQTLHAAATPRVAELVNAVATENAWIDPYDALYLGGVAREQDPVEVLPDDNVFGRPAAERGPLFPCPTDGPDDGSRDAWWSERDVLPLVDRLAMPMYVGHVLESGVPLRQSHAFVRALLDTFGTEGDVLRYVSQRTDSEFWDDFDRDTIRNFVRFAIDPVASVRIAAEQSLRNRGGGYGSPLEGCLLCYGTSGGGRSGEVDRGVSETSYFLNRTFEQDLECTPACVPGPGTGEIGSLEAVNRFESPWASVFSWVDAGADSERLTVGDPLNDGSGAEFGDEALPGGHGYHSLAFRTAPFEDDRSIFGSVRLDGVFDTGSAGGHVTPLLTAVGADGYARLLARGAFDLDFASGRSQRAHVDGWKAATITFDAVLGTVREGERLQVILQSNNIGTFEAGTAQGMVSVATGPVEGVTDTGSVLHVPFLDSHDWGL